MAPGPPGLPLALYFMIAFLHARETGREGVQKLGIDKIRRHIFLCCDQTKPKCSDRELSLQSWEYLKLRLKELGPHKSGRPLQD